MLHLLTESNPLFYFIFLFGIASSRLQNHYIPASEICEARIGPFLCNLGIYKRFHTIIKRASTNKSINADDYLDIMPETWGL